MEMNDANNEADHMKWLREHDYRQYCRVIEENEQMEALGLWKRAHDLRGKQQRAAFDELFTSARIAHAMPRIRNSVLRAMNDDRSFGGFIIKCSIVAFAIFLAFVLLALTGGDLPIGN